jgi:hypothetical protein
MKQPEDPLAWWELSETRKTVAISFLVGLLLAFLALFPDVNRIYEQYSGLRNFLAALFAVLGMMLAFLELRHSGEANEHRAEENRLTEIANKLRDEANKYRGEANSLINENNKLQRDALELQLRIHQLQESIEKKITKVRLYARAHLTEAGIQLLVSNLSEFDLWINQVELIVTEAAKAMLETRTIGGATRISRGHTEDGYKLYGALLSINSNRTDVNMKFHIKVVATGVADDPVTINSPEYHLVLVPGKTRELKVLKR